jgi:hypothetical protein
MRTTSPEIFLHQMRTSPKFVAAVAEHPELVEHADAIEYAISQIYQLGDEDAKWLDMYDQIGALLARESMSIKARLLALGEILRPVHAEATRRPGH